MNVEVVWEDPPVRVDHSVIAASLRENPGVWGRIDKAYDFGTAKTTAYQINVGKLAAYRPEGDYEAVRRTWPDGSTYIYVRYLGDGVADE